MNSVRKAVLQVNGISKKYRKKRIVNDLSFSINAGDIFGLVGPNGSGKTTTARMILNLVSCDTGNVKINGYDIHQEYKKAMLGVGVSSDTFCLYDYLNAYENLKIVWDICKKDKHSIKYLLQMVGLEHYEKMKVKKYSTGMKQKLCFARTLLNKPNLVIMDEPTNGIDPRGIRDFYRIVKDLAEQENVAFLLISHSLREMEMICNKVLLLDQGKTITCGSVNELTEDETLEELFLRLTDLDSRFV